MVVSFRAASPACALLLGACFGLNPDFSDSDADATVQATDPGSESHGPGDPGTDSDASTTADPSTTGETSTTTTATGPDSDATSDSGDVTSDSSDVTSDTDGVDVYDVFARRREITIDPGVLTFEGALSEFPIPVMLLWEYAAEDNNYPEDRYRFALESGGGLTALEFEFEGSNPNKPKWVWLRMPELDPGGGPLTVWMFYDGPAELEPDFPYTPTEVWDEDYQGVYHFPEVQAWDATVHMHDLVKQGNADSYEPGRINKAIRDTNPDVGMSLDLPHNELLGTGAGSFSAWVKTSPPAMEMPDRVLYYGSDQPDGPGWLQGYRELIILLDGNFAVRVYFVEDSQNLIYWWHQKPLSPDTWHHVAVAWDLADPDKPVRVHVDGAPDTIMGSQIDTPEAINFTGGMRLASTDAETLGFKGVLDEARLSTLARGPAYLKAEYEVVKYNDELVSVSPLEEV